MHLLFRSTAWSMGATDLQNSKCGIREAGPALLQSRPPKFFCVECRNTRPIRPSRPERALLGGFMGRQGGFWKNATEEIKRQCDLFLLIRARGRVGREIFTSHPFLFAGAIGADIHAPIASVAALNML